MLNQGQVAPAFILRGTDGALRGRIDALEKGPLLVVFYKVDCPTCEITLPKVQQLHEAYGEAITVWGIVQDEEPAVGPFVETHGLTFPQLLDEAEEDYHVSRRYGFDHVPSLFLIGTDGKILRSLAGWDREAMNALSTAMAELAGKAALVLSTPDDGLPVFQPGCGSKTR